MKNNMILRLAQTMLAALLPVMAAGQNLNPTVEVSKEYEGKLMEAHKPQLDMAVPDTVYSFNLDFDYSVAKTPYKGTYEFSPYSVKMAPAPAASGAKSLYLKAGAGYQLHPELDFVWSPAFKRPMKLNVYASHDSFLGNYWKMDLKDEGKVFSEVDRIAKGKSGYRTWVGYDFMSKAGVEGRYDWEKALFRFDLLGEGLQQKDMAETGRSFFAVDAKAGVASKFSESLFSYKVDASYRYGEDHVGDSFLKENDIEVDTYLGYLLDNGHVGLFDIGAGFACTDGQLASGGGDIDFAPHYLIETDRWRFDIGFRYSTIFNMASATAFYEYDDQQLMYPDVRVECLLLKNALKVYLDLGGDSRLNSYSDLIRHDRRADMFYGRGLSGALGVSEEKLNATLGLEGRLWNYFSYDLKGGYANVGRSLLDGVVFREGVLLPALGYSSYEKFFGAMTWLLDLDNLRVDGALEYSYLFNMSDKYRSGLFFPPSLKGDVAVSYNWKKRVLVSVDCEFSTVRKGSVMTGTREEPSYLMACIPGFADLGLNAEYAVNRKLSVWLKGGNLLGMTVRRNILYAEKGPYFTAGVCLNL